ncbi:MAG: VWA domain-containing protein [Pyrinomonadaceae bacterium]
MRFSATAIILCFACFAANPAQSGRRLEAPATPVPAITYTGPEYSESNPQKKNPIFRKPPAKLAIPEKPATSTASVIDEGDVERIDTSLVTIPVSVFDRNGLYIPNLRQDDFKIFENGVEQEIAYFGTTEKPVTVVLLIDTSPSTGFKIDQIRMAAAAFVDQLKPQDQVMVIEFDSNVHVLTEVTKDRERIYRAIKKADFGDGTSLYSAVVFTLQKRLSKIAGRKAVVLFTDGVDTTSGRNDYDGSVAIAEEADSLIFPIYYNTFFDNSRSVSFPGSVIYGTRGTSAEEYALGKRYLEDLAAYTGGRVFRAEATPGGLSAAFTGIAEELRRQYNIGYVPKIEGAAGERKSIKVRVSRPNLVLRARDSYIVGKVQPSVSAESRKSP